MKIMKMKNIIENDENEEMMNNDEVIWRTMMMKWWK